MSQPNPYLTPESAFAPAAKNSYANQTYVPFQSLITLGNVVGVMLGIVALAKVAAAIATINLVFRAGSAEELGNSEMQVAAVILGLAVIGAILLSIITGIVYFVWLYRAYANLPALGVDRLDASPGWAIGHYFIPILNLFRPYQTMAEIWSCSIPLEDNRQGRTSSAIVGWWWAGWIIAALLGQVSGAMVRGDVTPDLFIAAAWVDVAMHVISVATAILAALMIRWISENQERRYQSGATGWSGGKAQMANANPFAPPSAANPPPLNPFSDAPSADPFAPRGP
jgi:hypothetical protein